MCLLIYVTGYQLSYLTIVILVNVSYAVRRVAAMLAKAVG